MIELGELDRALESFNTAIRQKPDFGEAYNNRGNLQRIRGDVDAALADLNRAQALVPNESAVFINRGLVYYAAHDYEHAIGELTKAILQKPGKLAWVYVNRAQINQAAGHFQAALNDFAAALELEPRASYVLVNRAVLLRELGQKQRSLADLDEAIHYDGGNSTARYNRAVLKDEMGNTSESLADIDELLRHQPDHFLALAHRATLGLGNAAVGQAECLRAEELLRRPDPAGHLQEAREAKALLALHLTGPCRGDLQRAVNLTERALKDDPADSDNLRALVDLHLRLARESRSDQRERRVRALEVSERALKIRRSPALLRLHADLLDLLGRPGAASERTRAGELERHFTALK